MTAADFENWRGRHGFSLMAAADVLGLSRPCGRKLTEIILPLNKISYFQVV
jgi:hypothetical protein